MNRLFRGNKLIGECGQSGRKALDRWRDKAGTDLANPGILVGDACIDERQDVLVGDKPNIDPGWCADESKRRE
jgi:hypothetical protein